MDLKRFPLLKSLISCSSFLGGTFFLLSTTPAYAITNIPGTTLGTSNTVTAIAVFGTTTYIGGSFGSIAYNTREVAKFSTSNGAVDASFPSVDVQTLYAAIPDKNGGWYIGGDFTYVGSTSLNHIAHIKADNSVDQAFNPNVSGGVASVRKLALSSNGSVLYAGGSFTTVGSTTTRNSLAAFNTSDGSVVTGFNPNVGTGSNNIFGLALSPDDSTLYVGGNFTAVGSSVSRNRLAAFNTSDGSVTSFNPNMNNDVNALAVSPDGTTLYAGGLFTTVNGSTTRNNLAAFTPASTSTASSFNPNLNGGVNDLQLSSDGTTLYAGGLFTTVNSGTITRNRLAAFTPNSTSTPTGFDPNIGSTVQALGLSPNNGILYVGGTFTTVGPSLATTRNRLASFNTSDGSATSFDPNLDANAQTIAVSPDNNSIVAGGTFLLSNRVFRNRLASFNNANGTLNSFDPNISGPVLAMALSSDGGTLYIGGSFNGANSVNGSTTRNRIAAISTSNGLVTSFDPNMNGTVNTLVLSPDNTILYAGGLFNGTNSVNGNATRNKLASFTTSDGIVTGFDPNMGSSGSAVNALALTSDGTTLYVGGTATTTNGTIRNRLASFTPLSTSTPTSFDPNISNGAVTSLALSPDNGTLYVGGTFTGANDIGGSNTRVRLMSFTTSSGILTDFDPRVGNQVSALAVSSDGNTLYAAGTFTDVNVGTVARNRLAAFTPNSTSTPTNFNPNMNSVVSSLALASNGTLYAGGSFTTAGSNPLLSGRSFYAAFTGVPNAPSSLGPANHTDGSASTSTTPTLSFTTADTNNTDSVSFQIQIATSSDFASLVVDYTSTTTARGIKSFTVGQALSDAAYYWRVRTIDMNGTPSAYSLANSGSVAFLVDTTAPIISSISANPDLVGATINWTTSESSDSEVEYGIDSSYGNATTLADISGTTAHSVSISGLAPCKPYHYRVNSRDLLKNAATGPDGIFTTRGCPSGSGRTSSAGARSAAAVTLSTSAPLVQSTQPKTSALMFTRSLSAGLSGTDVKNLQKRLKDEGVYSGPVTGYYGMLTKAGVIKLQAKYGLPRVGIVGPKTLQILRSSR